MEAIDSFIEEHVSVEPFSQMVKNEIEGAPAVHPRMMLKILFYSYAKGVYSSREMEDRMRWDPNYIYLSANQRVDHSTILTELEQEETEPKGRISLIDRDARMVKDKDSKYMGNNCQIAVDEKSHAIIGAEVFNTASDRGLLQPMIEEVRNRTGKDLSRTEIGVDAGYFSSDNIRYSHDQALDVYLPEGTGGAEVRQWKGDLIRSRDCRLEIDGEIRRLICPGGQVMEVLKAREDRGNYFYRFHPETGYCRNCRLRTRCYPKANTQKGFSVKKEYFDNLLLREKMTRKLSSERGKKRMKERACLIEHVFGETKDILKFRRFLHRGLEKVRLIWQLVCIGYNFRKMARLAYG